MTSSAASIGELRQRVHRMQGTSVRRNLASLPGLAGLVQLRTGGAYAVDSPSLALALIAGPSQAGEWTAVAGVGDLGLESAAEFGLDLDRTVVVPRPGEHWLSVAAGLADVASVVVVRPSVPPTEQQAERLRARLRQKDATLIALGAWPRSEARLRIVESHWVGLGSGNGRITARQVVVAVDEAGGQTRRVPLWLPGPDLTVTGRIENTRPLLIAEAG